MLKLYLAGWSGETTYRNMVKEQYGKDEDFQLFDPFDYHPTGTTTTQQIVEGDKRLISDCDAVIAKVDRYSAGTMMEIIYAWSKCIPVYLISSVPAVRSDTWIIYHIEARFSTFHECFEYLRQFEEGVKEKPDEIRSQNPELGTKDKTENCEKEIVVEDKIVSTTDERYGLNDDKVATKLLDKNCSPMIIRKYTRLGFPLYIHLICDESLSDLDDVIHDGIDEAKKIGMLENDIQRLRNFTGFLSDRINEHYDAKKRGCVESLGVIYYVDKMMITSLQGDCMNHDSCRRELYECLNIMTKI